MMSEIIKNLAIAAIQNGSYSFMVGNNKMPHTVRRSESAEEGELFPEGCSYVGEFLYRDPDLEGNSALEYVVLKQTLRKD